MGANRGQVPWSPAEDQILRDQYQSSTTGKLATVLPGRSVNSIIGRAYRLGLSDQGDRRARGLSFEQRLLSHVRYDHGCWEWTGYIDPYGYGKINRKTKGKEKAYYAHRAVFVALGGVIPDGLHLDHLCRNTRCVNPLHLEPVTCAENTRRGIRFELPVAK